MGAIDQRRQRHIHRNTQGFVHRLADTANIKLYGPIHTLWWEVTADHTQSMQIKMSLEKEEAQ